MRRLAATALALCGCNQIYGLEPTRGRDASVDTRNSEVRLSMLIGQATLDAREAPPFVAPVPNPQTKVALLGEPLQDAPYIVDTESGIVTYRFDLVGQRWRLEYTPPFDVPHEIQWSPADTAGHLVVPLVGRMERASRPVDTGYTMSMKLPGNVLYNFSGNTVIYTAGYWSSASTPATLTPSIDFSKAPSLDFRQGAPEKEPGDVVVAVDYQPNGTCMRAATISGSATAEPLTDGTFVPLELTRFSETEVVTIGSENETIEQARQRLVAALGSLSDASTDGRLFYGRMAHTGMPSFTTTLADVPAPLMIPIAECTPGTVSVSANHVGGGLSFTKGVFVYTVNDRMVGTTRLRSSIAAIGLLNNLTYVYTTHVPLATNVAFNGVPLTTDGTSLGTAGDLTFTLETDPRFVADYYEVTLQRLDGISLQQIRTYVGIDLGKPKVRFDPSIMNETDTYVFAIRVYRGRPNARVGDFRGVMNPQAVSTLYTPTFKR